MKIVLKNSYTGRMVECDNKAELADFVFEKYSGTDFYSAVELPIGKPFSKFTISDLVFVLNDFERIS